jgi:hypothetical protein
VFDQFVEDLRLEVDAAFAGLRDEIDRVHDEMETVELVQPAGGPTYRSGRLLCPCPE